MFQSPFKRKRYPLLTVGPSRFFEHKRQQASTRDVERVTSKLRAKVPESEIAACCAGCRAALKQLKHGHF